MVFVGGVENTRYHPGSVFAKTNTLIVSLETFADNAAKRAAIENTAADSGMSYNITCSLLCTGQQLSVRTWLYLFPFIVFELSLSNCRLNVNINDYL